MILAQASDEASVEAMVANARIVLNVAGPFSKYHADNIVGETPDLERRFQELRVAGIVSRAEATDDRFGGPRRTRAYLDAMERLAMDLRSKR